MKTLETQFTKGNPLTGQFFFNQVTRNEFKALYKKEFALGNDSPSLVGYELFLIKEQKEMNVVMGGIDVHLEHKEVYPGDNAFGKTAWMIHSRNLQDAMNRFNALEKPTEQPMVDVDGNEIKRRGRPRKNT